MINYNKSNPFNWDEEPVRVSKEDSVNTKFKSIPSQKNATYTEPAEEQFTNTAFDSFVENIEAPTPQIRHICGLECK